MPKTVFDMRIEVTQDSTGSYTAKTIVGQNGVLFPHTAGHISDAICDMICDMDVCGIFQMIELDPKITHFFLQQWSSGSQPATNNVLTSAPNSTTQKYNGPLMRAVDIGSEIPKGQCEPMCMAYDQFGSNKCASLCPSRKKG